MDELINGIHKLTLDGNTIDRLLLYLKDLETLIGINEGAFTTIEIAPNIKINAEDLSTFKGFINPDDLNAIDTFEKLELYVDDKLADLIRTVDILEQNDENLFSAHSESTVKIGENLALINDLKSKITALNNGEENVVQSIAQMIAKGIEESLAVEGKIGEQLNNKVDKRTETIAEEVIIPTNKTQEGYLIADEEDQQYAHYVISDSNAYLEGIRVEDSRISIYVEAGLLKPGDQVVIKEVNKTWVLGEEDFKTIYKVYLDSMMKRNYLDSNQVTALVATQVLEKYNDLLVKIENLERNKVDKVEGKMLSSNDFTNEDKNKLDNIIMDEEQIKQIIDDAFDSVFKNK